MKYTLNREQFSALEGLAYRIADSAYMRERFGSNEPELQQNHKTISGLFSTLDRLAVPYWVQNAVIVWAENWRRYKEQCLNCYLQTRGITVA